MPQSDMEKALELLKTAQLLLAESEVKNLRISAEYLKASIELLSQGNRENGPKCSAQRSR